MSGIAALPRIVTLHDIEIHRGDKASADELTLDVTAKTYRYLDEEAAGGNGEVNGDAQDTIDALARRGSWSRWA